MSLLACCLVWLMGGMCPDEMLAANAQAPDANEGPQISTITDQFTYEDTPILLPVVYTDRETPFGELRFVVISHNTTLVPVENIRITKSQPAQVLITPAPNQFGEARISLRATDDQGKQSSLTFGLHVLPVNDPPRLSVTGQITIPEDSDAQTIRFTVSDPDNQDLEVTVISSDPTLIPNQSLRLDGTGENRTLTLRPAADRHGSAVLKFTARDPDGALSAQDLTLRVLPVNDPPRLSPITNQRVPMNQTLDPIALTVTDDQTPSSELILIAASSNPILFPEGNILLGGSGEQRTLSVRPARNVTGTALISIKAYDQERLEATASFILTVERVNAPPELAPPASLTIDQDKTSGPLIFSVTDPDGPVELLRLEATSSNTALVSQATMQLAGAGTERSITLIPKAGASGTADITLTVTDPDGALARGTFTLTVRAAATRPIADPLALTINEDSASDVILKGSSAQGSALSYFIVAPPQKGVLSGTPPQLVYVPNPNVSGLDTFQFKVSDGEQESLLASVSITVLEINDPPIVSATPNRRTEPGKTVGPIRFVLQDLETPLDRLTLTARSSNPDLVPDRDILVSGQEAIREVSITSAPGQIGVGVITVTVTDGGGLSATTSFELSVAENTGTPTAEAQSILTLEDLAIAVTLQGKDPERRALSYTIIDQPAKGTVRFLAPNAPTVFYSPNLNETGLDRFTFRVGNGITNSQPATVEILIMPVNDPPSARTQSYPVKEDTALEVELTGSDPEKDLLTFEVVGLPPTKGKLSGAPPRLTYTPNPNETGSDQFTFIAHDGEFTSPTPGTIRISIEPSNDPPLAPGSFVSGPEDTALSIRLQASDVDGDPLSYTIVNQPVKGILAGTAPDLIFIPNANATGIDRFTFKVSDGKMSSEQAVVTLMLIPSNDSPAAESQFVSLQEDGSIDIVLGARDLDNDTLSFIIMGTPLKGSLSGTAPRLSYKPNRNFHGFDSFTFKVNDGVADSLPAIVTISVREVNDLPVASDQFVTLNEDTSHGIILTGQDVDGGTLAFFVVDSPKHGSLSGVPPNLTYTPAPDFNGADSFNFRVGDGELDSSPAVVSISVRPVNDAPRAETQFLTATRGQSRVVTLGATDAEGTPLQFILATLPIKGTLSGRPPDLTYHSNPAETGLDSFSFKATDGLLESSPGTVQIALTERTSGPTISSIPDQTAKSGQPTAKLPFNIGDANTTADKLIVAASSSDAALVPVERVILEGRGPTRTVQVLPLPGKTGSAEITLVVWDEDGLAASSRFKLIIDQGNRPPTAEAQALTTLEDQPAPIELKGLDPDGETLTYLIVSQPRKGRLAGEPPRLSYIPNTNDNGIDSFTFKSRDGTFDSAEATVNIQIQPVNDPPSISSINDQIIDIGQTLGPIQFEVSDPDTANLSVTVTFSIPDLITPGSSVSGSGRMRSLTLSPASGKSGTTTVTLSVSDGEISAHTEFKLTILGTNVPPVATLNRAFDYSVIEPGTDVLLEAAATDSDGLIRRVEFYDGPTLLGSDDAVPYQLTWRQPDNGFHTLTAKATDDRGATAISAPVHLLVTKPVAKVAVLATTDDDPDIGLIRRYLYELSVQWRMVDPSSANAGSLIRDYDLTLWHQPGIAALQARHLEILESILKASRPLYFLGDSLLSAGQPLSADEKKRWFDLIHLKPGGTDWLNQVILDSTTSHPVILGGRAGTADRFAYPVTPRQAGTRTGNDGEVVLGRSGNFDILVAAVDPSSSARTFTHHLLLGSATDAVGLTEQMKLFQNAVLWLIARKHFLDLAVQVPALAKPIAANTPFEYKILVHHSGESPAYDVTVTDRLPAGVTITGAKLGSGTWSQKDGIAIFDLGHFRNGEDREIVVNGTASLAGLWSHTVTVKSLDVDSKPENDSVVAAFLVIQPQPVNAGLVVRRSAPNTVHLEFPSSGGHVLEGSTDLVTWSAIPTSQRDPQSLEATLSTSGAAARFFRIVPGSAKP